ncbi:MAG TPA: outer membrane lipoprotein chaperone LolA [Terriglobales bacterium]|nr:outer membrane lipoprotein chaperone LolA [Terriglobales bacterium]
MAQVRAATVVALALLLQTTVLFGQVKPKEDQAAKKIAAQVDAKYNKLKTLQTEFVENYSGAGVIRKESGTLILKRSGKMRWDFTQPREKLFVSDGKSAYFYVPAERQVRKASVKKLDDFRSPIRYLLGHARVEKEFAGLRIESAMNPWKAGNTLISGVPKHMGDRVQRVMLEVSPSNLIERIVIEEVDGGVTEFQFSRMVEDQAVSDQVFKFKIPPGVETIEAAELTGD